MCEAWKYSAPSAVSTSCQKGRAHPRFFFLARASHRFGGQVNPAERSADHARIAGFGRVRLRVASVRDSGRSTRARAPAWLPFDPSGEQRTRDGRELGGRRNRRPAGPGHRCGSPCRSPARRPLFQRPPRHPRARVVARTVPFCIAPLLRRGRRALRFRCVRPRPSWALALGLCRHCAGGSSGLVTDFARPRRPGRVPAAPLPLPLPPLTVDPYPARPRPRPVLVVLPSDI